MRVALASLLFLAGGVACANTPQREETTAPLVVPPLAPNAAAVVLTIAAVALARRNRKGALAISVMLTACSSTPPYEGTPLDGSSLRERDDEADDLDPSVDDGPSEGPSDPPEPSSGGSTSKPKGACAGEATQKSCFECCTEKTPQAVDIYTRLLEGCLCGSPGTRKAACEATLCSGFKADATCADCLRGEGLSCEDSAFTACEKDPGCGPMLDCASDSRCSSK